MSSGDGTAVRDLDQLRRNFAALFEGCAAPAVLGDTEGRLLAVNEAFASLLGQPRAAFVGAAPPFAFWPEHRVEELHQAVDGLLRDGSLQLESEFLHADGHAIPVALHAATVRGAEGEVLGFVGTGQALRAADVDRDTLAAARDHFQTLFEHAPIGLARCDAEGRVVEGNAEARLLLRAGAADLRDRPRLIHEWGARRQDGSPLPAAEDPAYHAATRNAHVRHLEMGLDRDEGQPLWMNVNASPWPLPEGGALLAFTDLTERRAWERAAVDTERMAAVRILAAGVAHEFNNAMTGLSGYLSLLLERSTEDEHALRCLLNMRRATDRIQAVTENLLVFADGMRCESEALRLGRHVIDTVEILRGRLESEGIELTVITEREARIQGARDDVRQIVVNLVDNAHHALLERAHPRIEIVIGRDEEEGWLRVRDNGCGMDGVDLRHATLPFFSRKGEHALGDTPQSKLKGTGLGLSVCKQLALNHGGRLELESEPGQGATVTVYFPLAAEAKTPPVGMMAIPREVKRRGEGRFLILDDDPDVRTLLRVLIEKGYGDVIATDDMHEALASLRTHAIDMVFVDLQMPKGPGVDFLRGLRALPLSRRPITVVISGSRRPEAIPGDLAPLVHARVAKPFTPKAIRALLDQVFIDG